MSKSFEFLSTVAKADPVLRQLSGVIYKADELDSQGEFTTAQELTKAAHAALRDGVAVDVDHSGKPLAKQHAAVVESSVKDGVWSAVVQLSKEAWAQLVESERSARSAWEATLAAVREHCSARARAKCSTYAPSSSAWCRRARTAKA